MKTHVVLSTRIDRCCDTESARYALRFVQVTPDPDDPDMVYAAATDARCLAITHLEGASPTEMLIPREALAKRAGDLGGSVETTDGKTFTFCKVKQKGNNELRTVTVDEPAGRFPQSQDIMALVDGDYLQVSLDVEMLTRLADAVGRNEEHRYTTLFIRKPTVPTLKWEQHELCPEIEEVLKHTGDRDEILLYLDLTTKGQRNRVCCAVDQNRMDAEKLTLGTRVNVSLSRHQCGADFVAMAAGHLFERAQMAIDIHHNEVNTAVYALGSVGIGAAMPCGGSEPAVRVGEYNQLLEAFKAARYSVPKPTEPDDEEEEPDDEVSNDTPEPDDEAENEEEAPYDEHADVLSQLQELLAASMSV